MAKIQGPIKAYKIFDEHFKCRDFQFEVGKTYVHDGPIKLCELGFHACESFLKCNNYYKIIPTNKYAEVLLDDDIIYTVDKIVTNKITIVKEIPYNEVLMQEYKDQGHKVWTKNGKLHRDEAEGPAIECGNGTKKWFKNGYRHRDDGPAIEYANGRKEWYRHGKLHHDNGPIVEYSDGTKIYIKK